MERLAALLQWGGSRLRRNSHCGKLCRRRCARSTTGADPSLSIGLHRHLHHHFGDAAQDIIVSSLRQRFGKRSSIPGHRAVPAHG
ncbi:hypothetical protein [Rhodovastum atsumiense]|uniref:Uncharacterized protein n=1 Tax=Rhodovastum atsumiense TaxID=504468 RepID=A0A5M6J280_9PROT|nr:hypothetical protein [Rhodovastum atsumiense]KAA5614641.1 hypothetical protein F1189_00485 [Rhodovastum atsumiense]